MLPLRFWMPYGLVPWTKCMRLPWSTGLSSKIWVLILLLSRFSSLIHLSAVIDRQFKGEIANTMDKLTTRALQAQVEAAVCVSLRDPL